ncbi:MAG: hypothetical protein R3178_10495, partial [Rhodothermales bacterium]|nr:hypothetical protein [Rhodothermales bacterium]
MNSRDPDQAARPAAVPGNASSASWSRPLIEPTNHQEESSGGPSFPDEDRLTRNGFLAFLVCLATFGSALPAYRPSLLGLSLHPFLVVSLAALPFAFSRRYRPLYQRGLSGVGIVLLAAMFLSSLTATDLNMGLRVYVKWLGTAFTFLLIERLIVTRKDFLFAAYGLIAG